MKSITDKILNISPWHFLWVAIIISEVFTFIATSIFCKIWLGEVPRDILIVGAFDSFVVSLIVTFIVIYFVHNIKQTKLINEKLEQRVADRTAELSRTLKNLEDEIEERSYIQESLRVEKDKTKQYLDIAGVIIVAIDASQRVLLINKKGCEMLGYEEDEIIGINWFDSFLSDRFSQSAKQYFEQLVDGTSLPLEVEYSQNAILTKAGEEKIINWKNSLLKDENNKIIGILASGEDITSQIELEDQLRQAHKMEAVGTLAAGIAHEFNNILTAMLGYAELIRDELPEDSQAIEDLEVIFKSGHRARDLVQQILTFSRQTEYELVPVMIGPIIKETMKLIRGSTPSTIKIHQDIIHDNIYIRGNPTQIQQLILNLSSNAIHAMGEKGTLEVTLLEVTVDGEETSLMKMPKPGRYIRLSVKDSGTGIEPSILENIFDPFFSTKAVDKGTGLGLSVVHGIVKSHEGKITVDSEFGQGTTFNIFFTELKDIETLSAEKTVRCPTGNENILFVDDELYLAQLGKQMLESLGYTVTSRTSSVEAFELFRQYPDRFDLIITDQMMPNMTGIDLATAVLNMKPDIPVILYSGYSSYFGYSSQLVKKNEAAGIGIRKFLSKPLSKTEIAVAIRKVLDE